MAKLLVVEKSAALREFLRLHLETAGHSVTAVEDGGAAERIALTSSPQLVVAGGGNEGLRLMERLRTVASVPLILVSTRGDADSIAEARAAGAADCLVLPVTREALLQSVAAHLAGAGAAPPTTTDLRGLRHSLTASGLRGAAESPSDADGVEGDTLPPFDPATTALSARDGHSHSSLASQEARSGTVLFADIRNFSALAETLTTQELADLLNSYFVRACEPILQQGGWIVKLLGDGILAMFEPRAGAPNHAERGLKAGLFLCIVAQRFDQWLERRFPDQALPDFAVGIGVHTGDVMVCRINTGAGVDTTIIGDTVNVASRLEEQTKKLGASLVTSLDTLALAGTRFVPGQRGSLLVRGRASPVEITEITGLRPRPNVDDRGLQTYAVIHDAVAHNTQIIVRERDQVLAEPHRIRHTGQFSPLRPADSPVRIPGFRLLRRLGQGGMSRAFLAEYESTGSTRVLKVLNVAEGGYDLLRRFMQEYELISQIRHPHVATIFDRGQTDTHAYIVMEYLPGGDLRQRLEGPLAPEHALEYLRQIAEALVAIHARGIVHRDLKPDNIMLREDGTLVLSDFGIAKDLSRTVSHTRYGEGLGTPYYLSPEQAQGGKVDQRSDLYSLGVMLFEMLTGEKPYHAEDGPALLRKHVQEPVPTLPVPLAPLQPLLQRLMAKTPAERFGTSEEALQAIRALMV
ncbi:MAG TPA: protein kinase [Burkholderiales bacterium]|nr:protein kinase [Burkholderiales bacterium]